METIDVSGLPEPIVQQLKAMVCILRKQLSGQKPKKQQATLPVWRGTVTGSLTRNDIYNDVG